MQAQDAGSVTATASAHGAHEGAHFVEAPVTLDRCHIYQLNPRLDSHAVAVYDGTKVVVRAAQPLPDTLAIDVFCRADTYRPEPGTVRQLTIEAVSAAAESSGPAAFYEAAATFLEQRSRRPWISTRYDRFATGRLRALAAGQDESRRQALVARRNRSDLGDMMALFTGFSSVEEALQSDRGLRLQAAEPVTDAEQVAITSVSGVPLPSHPWPKMIDDIGGKTSMEPLAAHIPADVAYLHFSDLRTFVKAAGDVDAWGTSVALALETSGGVKHFTDRYEAQLAVERTGLAERLGHLAADGVAVLIGDPYIREGTDVTLVFRVRNRTLLAGALDGFLASAKERHPALATEVLDIHGVTVTRSYTSDLTVNRHQLELGEILAVTNSRAAAERLILTHQGKHPRLSESGDFRYMRTLYPYTKDESGFLFLGDALVARTVGPEQKIAESRRVRANADLLAVNHAALLYGWLYGTPPTSEKELLRSGLLASGDLVHGDGQPIKFHPRHGASSAWGTPARLRPLADTTLETATQLEVRAYERFRDGYQNNWSTYIDPIAAQIHRSKDGDYTVDARMLPLIDNSEYNDLRRYVGDTRMAAPPVGYSAHIAVAIAEDARLRRWADDIAFQTTGNNKLGINWLGDWVMAGIGDRSGLWDLALAGEIVDPGPNPPNRRRDLEAAIARAPVYVAAHVRNKLGLAAMLTALRAYSEQSAPGLVSWGAGDPYRDIAISEVKETMALRSARDPVKLSYATVGDVFILSLDRATLEEQIDAFLDGNHDGPADHQAVISMNPDPDKSWLKHVLSGLAEAQAYSNHVVTARGWDILARGRGGLPTDAAQRRALAMTWLGHEPVGLHGQVYDLDASGLIACPTYGSIPSPNVPELPVGNSPFTDAMDELAGLQMSISFEGENEHQGLRARMRWRRDP